MSTRILDSFNITLIVQKIIRKNKIHLIEGIKVSDFPKRVYRKYSKVNLFNNVK